MSAKKLLFSALAAACAAALLVPTAFAGHGCHGRAAQCAVQGYGVAAYDRTPALPCTVDGCFAQGYHTHDGATYCGHSHGNGVCDGSCFPVCEVEGCTLAGPHAHDGTTYCGGHHAGAYCNGYCIAVCAVDGCDLTGHHSHDGVTYCGYAHGNGYCDGTCVYAQSTVTQPSTGGGHHHGRHH